MHEDEGGLDKGSECVIVLLIKPADAWYFVGIGILRRARDCALERHCQQGFAF